MQLLMLFEKKKNYADVSIAKIISKQFLNIHIKCDTFRGKKVAVASIEMNKRK